jgi:hypothetical protein
LALANLLDFFIRFKKPRGSQQADKIDIVMWIIQKPQNLQSISNFTPLVKLTGAVMIKG